MPRSAPSQRAPRPCRCPTHRDSAPHRTALAPPRHHACATTLAPPRHHGCATTPPWRMHQLTPSPTLAPLPRAQEMAMTYSRAKLALKAKGVTAIASRYFNTGVVVFGQGARHLLSSDQVRPHPHIRQYPDGSDPLSPVGRRIPDGSQTDPRRIRSSLNGPGSELSPPDPGRIRTPPRRSRVFCGRGSLLVWSWIPACSESSGCGGCSAGWETV